MKRFNSEDILYLPAYELVKLVILKDFEVILFTEPLTIDVLSNLEILLTDMEFYEYYEYCIVLKKEIKRRNNYHLLTKINK